MQSTTIEAESIYVFIIYKSIIMSKRNFFKESLSTTMHCAPKPAWRHLTILTNLTIFEPKVIIFTARNTKILKIR
jgi:hypothetical protein